MKNVLLLMLSISLFQVSCKKDDKEPAVQEETFDIVGNWNYSESGPVVSGKETLTNYKHTDSCEKDHYEFKKDGVSVLHIYSEKCKDLKDLDSKATGTWTLNEKVLVINDLGEENIYDVLVLNETTLKIRSKSTDQYTFVFVKK